VPPGDATLPGHIGEPRLHAYPWLPAIGHGRKFRKPPDLLVIHSGATGDDVAGYLHSPGDGRQVSAHVASRSADGAFVQMVALTEEAWHAARSICQGRGGVNARSIGVELPCHRGDLLVSQTQDLFGVLVQVVPSLRWWTCHRWIRRGKRDPLCFDDSEVRDLMRPIGLVEVR